MANYEVDFRTLVVDNILVNSQLKLAPGSQQVSVGSALDFSGTAGTTITAVGGQSNLVSLYLHPTASGTIQQGALYSRIDGIATGGSGAGRIAGIFEASTGGGTAAGTGNNIWGLNINVYQQAADTTVQVIGSELNFGSNKANATLDMTPSQVAYSATSGGSKIAGIAFLVSGASQWMEGLQIASGSIASGGFAFRYKGNGSSGVVSISEDSKLAVGGLITANGGVQIANGGSFAGGMIYADSVNGLQIAAKSGSSFDLVLYNSTGSQAILRTNTGGGTTLDVPSGAALKISGNGALSWANQTSGPGATTGTLTNAPSVGNPDFWLPVTINGTAHWIPAWATT
jgi:hypothetical protein